MKKLLFSVLTAVVLFGCSDEMLTESESDLTIDREVTAQVATKKGEKSEKSRKSVKTEICHLPNGDAGKAKLLTVSPKSAAKHIENHSGDGYVADGEREEGELLYDMTCTLLPVVVANVPPVILHLTPQNGAVMDPSVGIEYPRVTVYDEDGDNLTVQMFVQPEGFPERECDTVTEGPGTVWTCSFGAEPNSTVNWRATVSDGINPMVESETRQIIILEEPGCEEGGEGCGDEGDEY